MWRLILLVLLGGTGLSDVSGITLRLSLAAEKCFETFFNIVYSKSGLIASSKRIIGSKRRMLGRVTSQPLREPEATIIEYMTNELNAMLGQTNRLF